MTTWTSGWQEFYDSAKQQSAIDPALVTAVAISESGWNANGRFVNLGIDSNGTPGLPGTPSGIGNATHRFYTYSSGEEAARGLAAYLQTPLYRNSVPDILSQPVERMLRQMVQHGYSGCPGPECDDQWDFKIMQIRTQVIVNGGAPNPGAPGSGIGGLTPPQAGGTPDPIGAVGGAVGGAAGAVGGAVSGAIGSGSSGVLDSANHILGELRTPGFWWTIGLFVAAIAAVLVGVFVVLRPSIGGLPHAAS